MSLFHTLRDKIATYSAKVNWGIFALIIVFSAGGWIEIFGVWAQLPLNELPEGWRLPSIITMVIQIGQIGSLIYLAINHFFPKFISFRTIILIKLIVTSVSSLLLGFLWDKIYFIFGEQRSVGLLILCLISALCDVPYVTTYFKKEYIIAYYIGETFYVLIPSLLAMLQGTGEDQGCVNVTMSNTTLLEPVPLNPAFSVSSYYFIISSYVMISLIAFIVLNCVRRSRKNDIEIEKQNEKNITTVSSLLDHDENEKQLKNERFEKIFLLTINFIITFILYGVMPGLNSYSTLPYGSRTFHLSINLGSLFLPLFILASITSINPSLVQIVSEFCIACCFAIYIVALSIRSPCPWLLDSPLGPALSILSWYLAPGIFTRVRCLISNRLERFGEKVLLFSGAMTLTGEVVGGMIMYILIEKMRLFNDMPECVSNAAEFCMNRKL